MAVRTTRFRIDNDFNVEDLNRFFDGIASSGGVITNQFQVQLRPGAIDYYVVFEDAVPPEVIRTFPSDGQVNVPAGSDIIIIFSEDVVLGATPFEILKDGTPVTGFTFLEADGRVEISNAIDADVASYTVRVIRTEVQDTNGNEMIQDHTFSFTSSLDPLSGAFIVDRINTSNAVINAANLEPDPAIKCQIHNNYLRSAGNRMVQVGATGVYADDFFTDFSDDPGAPLTPPDTTVTVDIVRMQIKSDLIAAGATGVFYSDDVPALGATGVLLEADADILAGGSLAYELIKDGEVAGFTSLTPGVLTSIAALASGFQLKANLVNPGTGGFQTVCSHELYFF